MSRRDPLGQILAVKQAREQRATSRLHAARTAERTALAARDAADAARSAHETARIEREAAIYRGLSGSLPGHRIQTAGAMLAVLQVHSTALGATLSTASIAASTSSQAAATAQRAHAITLRERAGAEALLAEIAALSSARAERQEEADMEDAFIRKPSR